MTKQSVYYLTKDQMKDAVKTGHENPTDLGARDVSETPEDFKFPVIMSFPEGGIEHEDHLRCQVGTPDGKVAWVTVKEELFKSLDCGEIDHPIFSGHAAFTDD